MSTSDVDDGWQRPTTQGNSMTTSTFWVCTGERAIKTFAVSLITMWGSAQFNILTVDWKTSLGISAGMGVLSVLGSIASLPIGPPQSPSLVYEKIGS